MSDGLASIWANTMGADTAGTPKKSDGETGPRCLPTGPVEEALELRKKSV